MKKVTMRRGMAIAAQMMVALPVGMVHAEEYGYGEDPSLSGEITIWNWAITRREEPATLTTISRTLK